MLARPILNKFALAMLAAPALMLGGCGGTVNRGLETVHQPVVSRSDYVFDAATDNGRLAPGEAQRLAGWMASLRLTYGDRIAIDDAGNAAAVARGEVAALVDRYGLNLSAQAPIVPGALAPGAVRVIVSRTTATVPNCPDFSRTNKPEFEGNTSSNYGCSVNANVASMIARPEDLVRGQLTADLADPALSIKAISTYRKATTTGAGGLKAESTGGK